MGISPQPRATLPSCLGTLQPHTPPQQKLLSPKAQFLLCLLFAFLQLSKYTQLCVTYFSMDNTSPPAQSVRGRVAQLWGTVRGGHCTIPQEPGAHSQRKKSFW